jgi:hypothetical protein
MAGWLALVHHDLVKRVLWPARDRREMGGAPAAGELVPRLLGEEGQPLAAEDLWRALRDQAPPAAPADALDAFGEALQDALGAARNGDLAGVLALETAFATLGAALARDG